MPFPIELQLIHPKPEACDVFTRRFINLPNVTVAQSRFEDLAPHDCFVTAANSFGIMNAGIDAAVIEKHGETLMQAVQHRIMDEYLGEQPIGTSFIIDTGNPEFPFIAHTPTMRVPGSIQGTDKVYNATFAAFTAIYQHNCTAERKIQSLVFPAMGCGYGGVSYEESARQMAVAYNNYLNPPHRMNWEMVAGRNREICYDGKSRMVR